MSNQEHSDINVYYVGLSYGVCVWFAVLSSRCHCTVLLNQLSSLVRQHAMVSQLSVGDKHNGYSVDTQPLIEAPYRGECHFIAVCWFKHLWSLLSNLCLHVLSFGLCWYGPLPSSVQCWTVRFSTVVSH
ncbi:uncharacterized protein EDB93DRAFT_439082 [Suillus bovinus]|uniref:uncharacterized protein n=1 Tax=Suillus bovinus TaxID=48563 RepID=UPI001B8814FA|nr:uncharacterized protein EDB93DRAFT_439082 [Suillus bovinus]KAG2159021.1 hypothetical protein EDB93DRAFT_439082 [Suillus bovinus]